MKQFVLWMAIVGLATTGCAQNRVFGPQARRGGADFLAAQKQRMPRRNIRQAMPNFRTAMIETDGNRATASKNSAVELAAFGDRQFCGCDACDDNCCGGCDDSCYAGDCCSDGCCSDGCCGGSCCDGGCASGCCGDGGCCSSGGCSSCGGRGCGLCQKLVGRVASGFCPHSGGYPESYNYNPSPPTGQVSYPYYTVRGPRDFLRNNPPSIGPY